jgi:hypothetical protein
MKGRIHILVSAGGTMALAGPYSNKSSRPKDGKEVLTLLDDDQTCENRVKGSVMSTNGLQVSVLPAQHERRTFGRRRAVWHAWIIPSSLQKLPCCIRNVSDRGALLELKVPEWLPATFDLFVDGPNMQLTCDLTHRGKHGVGVAFRDAELMQELLDYCNVPTATDRQDIGAASRFAAPLLTSALIRQILTPK